MHGAQLGNRNLVIGKHLQQEGLEFLVGAVDLVDQQHRRLVLSDRRQQRTLQQELLGEDVLLHCFGALAAALARFDGEQLKLVVPLVNRRVGVEALRSEEHTSELQSLMSNSYD